MHDVLFREVFRFEDYVSHRNFRVLFNALQLTIYQYQIIDYTSKYSKLLSPFYNIISQLYIF